MLLISPDACVVVGLVGATGAPEVALRVRLLAAFPMFVVAAVVVLVANVVGLSSLGVIYDMKGCD